MNLVIDIGNTQIFLGIFEKDDLKLTFRKSSKNEFSSDEFGVFINNVFNINCIDIKKIKNVCISSVVPSFNYTIRNSIKKYIGVEPIFVEQGTKTGINIKYKNPSELGADRIANCIGANLLYGNKNFIIIDMGTATTFDILTEKKEYLGGIIIPGPELQINSLATNTAKLPSVEFKKSNFEIDSTVKAIQSGIYFMNYYTIKGITEKIKKEIFKNNPVTIVATGGFSRIYEDTDLFDVINYDLILYGLNEIIKRRSNDDWNA